MELYTVTAVDLRTSRETIIEIAADEAETTEDIVLKIIIEGNEFSASDYAYLSAYQKLRDAMLAAGYGIKCNGSRLNAIQSGMMEACEKVYLAEPGKKASGEDIVCLYDYADISNFPDTEEQKEFARRWVESLARGGNDGIF